MRQHRTYTQNDDAPIPDGDSGFVGVDMRTSPHLLRPGFVSDARNARFRFGIAEPRRGVMPVVWSSVTDTFEFPVDWEGGSINFQNPTRGNLGRVFGVGVWNDPNGADWILVASSVDNSTIQIYRIRPGNSAVPVKCAVTINVPSTLYQDTNTESLIWFTQAFDKCILSRGDSGSHLVLTNFEEGFIEAPAASGAGGTENIPNARSTLFFQNRLLVPHKPALGYKADHVAVSDILDYTSYDPVYASFKINQGDSDEIERLYKFNDQSVVVFKSSSIYAVSNLVGDWGENAVLDQITTEFGLVGPRSVANVGADLWFLSQRGVVSLRQTEQNKLQGVSEPNSTPLQPIIDRIDMSVAKVTACAAYYQNRYYLSVPLDGSQKNNAVLVYDFLNKAWSGVDEGDAIRIKYFFVSDFQGLEQLFYVDYDGVVGMYEYADSEHIQKEAGSYTCDLVLTAQPEIETTVQVNEGTRVVATRYGTLVNDGSDVLVEDDGDTMIVDPRTGALPGDGVWNMGDATEPHCGTASDNLYSGYAAEGWIHNVDSVQKLDCGVRFTDSDPILIELESPAGSLYPSPYLQAICSTSVAINETPILFSVTTRGYGFAAGSRSRFQESQIFVSTWDPKYRITAIVDGVKEETVILNDTSFSFPDRTKYMTFGVEDWPITNVNDDHERSGREDYSVILDNDEADGGTNLGATGMVLDLHQYYTHKLRVDRRGAYYQIKFEGLEGRVRIHSVTAGSTPGQRREGLHGGLH